MRFKVWDIDWDISDEDLVDNFGSTVDDNGLPYTAKDLGLPARDKEVVVECRSPEDVADAVSDEYGWLVNNFKARRVREKEDE